MGRRGISPEDDQRWVFNRLARAYRARPPYPAAVVERLAELARGGTVVDVGAGTGLLAVPLAQRGLRVVAVEPARAMLEALGDNAESAGVVIECVHAAGEKTGLVAGSASLVVIADALHWLDPELAGLEARRLLTPAGAVAIVEVELAETPFSRALRILVEGANPRARRARADTTAQVLNLASPGSRRTVERFEDERTLDAATLEGVLRSWSFVGPALSDVQLERVVGEALELARREGGARWRRLITVTSAVAK